MSLDKRKIKTKHVELTGTQKDFDALADILRQAHDKLNIDIFPDDADLPGRIVIRKPPKGADTPTQWVYPKLSKALNSFIDGLNEQGDVVVDFGMADISERPDELIKKSPTLRKMNQTSIGKNMGFGDVINEDIVGNLQDMLDPSTQIGRQKPLSDMVPVWVYASDLVLHKGKMPLGLFAQNKQALEGITEYPPDLGGGGRWSSIGKEGYNQAYFVVLRVDKTYPFEMKLKTKSGAWDSWIKSRPVPEMMRLYQNLPPKTIGELMERFAVYTAARTFGLSEAFLAPIKTTGFRDKGQRVNSKSRGYEDKILVAGPIKSKTTDKVQAEYATYYGFVVIGKGPTTTLDLGRETIKGAADLPGWD